MLSKVSILLKRFDKESEASCFETNLLFLDLQTLHVDSTKYFFIFCTNPLELIFLFFFYI